MLILVGKAYPTIAKWDGVGLLTSPRSGLDVRKAANAGWKWGADNDSFGDKFNPAAYVRMLESLVGVEGCVFVAVPDVVGEAEQTFDRFEEWNPTVREEFGLPSAMVAQDGMTVDDYEWWGGAFDALFVGGTSEWKLGDDARAIVRAANGDGKWTHMGRVNSERRIRYAKAIGCDSVDGTAAAMFSDTKLPGYLRASTAPRHGTIYDLETSE